MSFFPSALNDFKNVFGITPRTAVKRASKCMSVLKGMMTGEDRASEKLPIRLQVEITDRCNYSCIMCDRTNKKERGEALNNDLPLETFQYLLDFINPCYVTLNGFGEPLLYKNISEVLSLCRKMHITTSMPCNLSAQQVLNTKVAESPPDIITFSIHGATKKTFESISRGSDYIKSMEAIRRFLSIADRNKTSVKVLCALQANNLFEYREMYELLLNMDLINDFSLVPAYDYGTNSSDFRTIPTDRERHKAVEELDNQIANCTDQKKLSFLKRWRDVVKAIQPNETRANTNIHDKRACLTPWFSTYISATGDVLPCCFLAGKEYVVGNVFSEPFDSIWNGNRYQKFRRDLRENRHTLKACSYCQRDDSSRIKNYGFLYRSSSKWIKTQT